MERAELREGPRAAGDQGLDGADIRAGILEPARRRLARAGTDRAWPRHDRDRETRRSRIEPETESRAAAGTTGQLRRNQAAAVRPHALLRELDVQRTPRRGGGGGRLPDYSRRLTEFKTAHPALFRASGFADHPYPVNLPPTESSSNDPDFTEFSELPRLASTLDRLVRIYGSPTRFPIYNNEYGYITNPPNHSCKSFRLAGHRGDLHQLGGIPVVAQLADRLDHAIPAVRPESDQERSGVRRVRERADLLRRRAQARVQRLPAAAVPAGHLDAAQAFARGLGMRPAGAISRASTPAAPLSRCRSSSSEARAGRSRRCAP